MKKILVLFCIFAVALLVIGGCKKKEEAPAPEPVIPEVEEPVLPEPIEPTAYVGEEEMISSVACVGGKISGVIKNVAESTVSLGTGFKVLLRGMVVKDPGCDKTELAPGDTTICTAMNGAFPVASGKNEIVIRISGAKEGQATVVCE